MQLVARTNSGSESQGDIERVKFAQRSANALDVAIGRLKQYWHAIKLVGDTMACAW
jgi:hypothetical protein